MLTLDFMEKRGVVHRDLKHENILVNRIDGQFLEIKIADFGLSTRISKDGKSNQVVSGTPSYIAPEIFQNKMISNKSDVFSIGSILYSIITNENLFKGRTLSEAIGMN